MKHIFTSTLLLIGLLLRAQQPEVSTDSLMRHVRYLASDELMGRLPGTHGYQLAVNYGMNFMSAHGIQPAGKDFWPQQVPIDINQIDSASVFIETGRDIAEWEAGVDFSVRGYSGSGNVSSEVVFCGYGFDSTIYSDYQNIDVKGKIVLVFKANPPFLKNLPQYSIRKAADAAWRHGAKAIVFVSQPNQKTPQQPIGSVMHGDGPMHTDMPQIQLSVAKAEQLFDHSSITLRDVQTLIDSVQKPHSLPLNTVMQVYVDATYQEKGFTQNVVGVLPGKDPVLRDEYIIVSAHLDHVGSIGKSVIYPGANDNASGSAAVLELARLFSMQKDSLKRSVIFVLFGSEEKGLVGAAWFAKHLPVEKSQIKAVFNMDCIASGDSLMVGNGKSYPDMWQVASNIAAVESLSMTPRTWAGGGADLTPLHNEGIPGLYFVTTNSYTYLHLPGDTPESLNQKLFTDMVTLVYKLSQHYVFVK